jgi:hypothetical protein
LLAGLGKMKSVFFAPKMDGYNAPYDHPLFEEEVYINPVPYLEYYKEHHILHDYWKCPAWQKSFKNAYVFFSQLDMEIQYDKNTGVIENNSFKYCTFDEGNPPGMHQSSFDGPPVHRPPAPYNGIAIGQVKQQLIFWPDDDSKNIWLEILPTPDNFGKHGIELIGGEFPFSRWFRPSLFAYKFHNESTVIKRGEPLGVIRFKNLDDYLEDIKLERQDIPEKLMRKSLNHSLLKLFLPNKSWGLIKDSPSKKCPVSWWRKKFTNVK